MRLAKIGKSISEETKYKIRQTKLKNLNNKDVMEDIK